MYRRILVPLDGSAQAERILPHAIEIAQRFGATIVLAHAVTSRVEVLSQPLVADPVAAMPVNAEVADDVAAAEQGATEEYFAQIAGRLRREGVTAEQVIVEGFATATLLDAIATQKIDLVAMTTHARSTIGRIFHGSVAASLLEELTVPALLLRADD